jgi:3'-phosphoadenosine 5'-phosphosulfate sulfotransferase (PAPS reductase)/FAD synthetase
MDEFFARHEKVALMFSGGKDSLACLAMARPYWDRLTVVWINAGNPYPETVELMESIRQLVPKFVEVRGDQKEFIATHGHPVDILPLSMTPMGRLIRRVDGPKVCAYTDCCRANMWTPAARYLAGQRFTGAIRGDKNSDVQRPPVKSGDTVNGVEMLFPLESMTDEMVLALVECLLPSYGRGIKTSLDCMNCTAYLHHNKERIAELKTTYPEVHAEVIEVLNAVRNEVAGQYIDITSIVLGLE